MVVWYPEVQQIAPSDQRPLGEQNLAVGSWVSDPELASYMRSRGFPATDASVRFTSDDNSASGSMTADDLIIHADCRLEGPSFIPTWGRDHESYETMWTPSGQGDTYEIVTWAGHRSRRCVDAHWRLSGTHAFARLFNDETASDHDFMSTEFAFGYVLKSALYARRKNVRSDPSSADRS